MRKSEEQKEGQNESNEKNNTGSSLPGLVMSHLDRRGLRLTKRGEIGRLLKLRTTASSLRRKVFGLRSHPLLSFESHSPPVRKCHQWKRNGEFGFNPSPASL